MCFPSIVGQCHNHCSMLSVCERSDAIEVASEIEDEQAGWTTAPNEEMQKMSMSSLLLLLAFRYHYMCTALFGGVLRTHSRQKTINHASRVRAALKITTRLSGPHTSRMCSIGLSQFGSKRNECLAAANDGCCIKLMIIYMGDKPCGPLLVVVVDNVPQFFMRQGK